MEKKALTLNVCDVQEQEKTVEAVLGAQLVITLIMISIIQKLGKHYSLARWMLCSTGLIRYLYPTNDELRTLAGVSKDKGKGKKDRRHHENGVSNNTFHVPRNMELQLEKARVTFLDVIHLRYYSEYQWLLDFSLYAVIVYTLTEIYSHFFTLGEEINLSILWCFLVIIFSMKVLLSLTLQYFKMDQSIGERSTVIVTFFGYLVFSMAILLVDERHLETGLESAYHSFNASAHEFLKKNGLNSEGPASKLFLKFTVALWCALIGALFTFPGLRMARMQWDSLKYTEGRPFLTFLLHLNFATPFIVSLFWLRPLTRHYLTNKNFSHSSKPLMTEDVFEGFRLLVIPLAALLRLCLLPVYLQSYLDLAQTRVTSMKREGGRITNRELQEKIASVFYYMCVVTLQYLIPVLMGLFYSYMYKTLGEYSWMGAPETVCLARELPVVVKGADSVLASAQEFTLTISSLKEVMTKEVARGIFGFATWWTTFAWFASSSLGLLYQTYFRESV